jgi:hypothetical protein
LKIKNIIINPKIITIGNIKLKRKKKKEAKFEKLITKDI